MLQVWRVELVLGRRCVYLLNLHYILLHFFEVCVFELPIFVQKRTLLAVTEDKGGNFLEVEVFVAREREYFVVVQVVHDDEDL